MSNLDIFCLISMLVGMIIILTFTATVFFMLVEFIFNMPKNIIQFFKQKRRIK